MPFTYDQAIAELTNNAAKCNTTDALMGLVRSVSVEATGSVTVLYSGSIRGDAHSIAVADGMVANGDDIRMMKF
jgi:hypothetical protein